MKKRQEINSDKNRVELWKAFPVFFVDISGVLLCHKQFGVEVYISS